VSDSSSNCLFESEMVTSITDGGFGQLVGTAEPDVETIMQSSEISSSLCLLLFFHISYHLVGTIIEFLYI
jgi:hypothetical protein